VTAALAREGRLRKLLVAALVGMALASSLAACGKRGAPVAPNQEENTYPRVYPRA
jgi:predicted small lipoprotein YifL